MELEFEFSLSELVFAWSSTRTILTGSRGIGRKVRMMMNVLIEKKINDKKTKRDERDVLGVGDDDNEPLEKRNEDALDRHAMDGSKSRN